MYCPRCGQEQVSGDLRFCPGCGLQMGLIAEILAHGGSLPQLAELAKKRKFFTRKNGVFFGVTWFIFFVLIITPFWGIMDVEEMAGLSAILGVFGSLLIMLFSLFMLPSEKSFSMDASLMQGNLHNRSGLHGGNINQTALPPQQTQSAQDYVSPQAGMWKAPDTGDLAGRGSVTENTTKLLKKEGDRE
ncbi:MAG: zinc ribbon domain-containing protein [Pyrinomonadaceae bacterium]